MKNICLMLLPLFLMSCLNKDNNIVSLLKEWEQKEILFPKEMYFTTMLRDTTYYNLQSEYKILAYVDSIGCTSCKLQLSAWSMLINEIDSLYNTSIYFTVNASSSRLSNSIEYSTIGGICHIHCGYPFTVLCICVFPQKPLHPAIPCLIIFPHLRPSS